MLYFIETFVNWLHQVLTKLQEVTLPNNCKLFLIHNIKSRVEISNLLCTFSGKSNKEKGK